MHSLTLPSSWSLALLIRSATPPKKERSVLLPTSSVNVFQQASYPNLNLFELNARTHYSLRYLGIYERPTVV